MNLDIKYDEELDCLLIKATGIIEFNDLSVINQAVHNHEKFRTNISQIFSCIGGRLDLSYSDLRQFAEDAAPIAKTFGSDRKLALVDSDPLNFGQLRQYEALLEVDPNVQIRIFKSIDSAQDWIAEGSDDPPTT